MSLLKKYLFHYDSFRLNTVVWGLNLFKSQEKEASFYSFVEEKMDD